MIIIADNLDKTWNADKDLTIQVEMLSTLLEIEDKIRHEMPDIPLKLKSILFLRKDIFDYLSKFVNEPDKLQTITHEINWEEYPEKLKQLLENRFKFVLGLDKACDIDKEVWFKYFDIVEKNEHPYKVIEKIITKRPRDLLYFVTKIFESTVNNNRKKATQRDINYAIDNYTLFLNMNIIAEIKAIFPEVEGILSRLQGYHGEKLEYSILQKIAKEYGYNKERTEQLVEELFDKGYMIGYDEKTDMPFTSIDELKNKLKERRYFGLLPNKVFVIAHAKYYYIKNSKKRAF
jgi:hypothetical protein